MDEKRKNEIRTKLNAVHKWPSAFMFKFILKPEEDKLTQLRTIFDESAEFSYRESRNGNYVSVTVREMIVNPDVIMDRYQAASEIEGIISL